MRPREPDVGFIAMMEQRKANDVVDIDAQLGLDLVTDDKSNADLHSFLVQMSGVRSVLGRIEPALSHNQMGERIRSRKTNASSALWVR